MNCDSNNISLLIKGGLWMRALSEQILRNAIEKAEQKNQQGLLIWLSKSVWNDIGDIICKGNEHYDFALSQIFREKEATITFDFFGIKMPAIYALPVQKLKNSEEYFQMVMNACKEYRSIGPILLIPSNEVAECFE